MGRREKKMKTGVNVREYKYKWSEMPSGVGKADRDSAYEPAWI